MKVENLFSRTEEGVNVINRLALHEEFFSTTLSLKTSTCEEMELPSVLWFANIFEPDDGEVYTPASEGPFTDDQFNQLKSSIRISEGMRNFAYSDSLGVRTVGVGFNLERSDARQRLAEVGANFSTVYSGKQPLTAEQAEKLFLYSVNEAIDGARRLFPDFNQYSFNVKRVLVDMVFNLGETQMLQFKRFSNAVKHERFVEAGNLLKQTAYYDQVGHRAVRNEHLLKGAGKSDHF